MLRRHHSSLADVSLSINRAPQSVPDAGTSSSLSRPLVRQPSVGSTRRPWPERTSCHRSRYSPPAAGLRTTGHAHKQESTGYFCTKTTEWGSVLMCLRP